MTPVALSVVVFTCVFGGAILGMVLGRVLPEHHMSSESKDVVKLGTGLIGTMAALVLGLVVASAKSSYDAQSNELTDVSAKTILLDRTLADYGPETRDIRGVLRDAVAQAIDRVWPKDSSKAPQLKPQPIVAVLFNRIEGLNPQNDLQRSLKAQALNLILDIGQTRVLMFEQSGNPISAPFLIILTFWLAIIFLSFGMYAPVNATVVVTLLVCAISVSAAIFLVIELGEPYQGLVRLSSTPLRNALAELDR